MFHSQVEVMDSLSIYASGEQLIPPHGFENIVAMFGNIREYIRKDGNLDPKWETDFLQRIDLPFPLTLSWDHTQIVKEMICHKKLAEVFTGVFDKIQTSGLRSKIVSFGGCFSFRQQRTGTKLSTHAWGIAIDLNPETNAQGTAGNMDSGVIEVFKDFGFTWGGNWEGKVRDPMHFQFCSGY